MSIGTHIIAVVMSRDGGVIKIFRDGEDRFAAADALALELGAFVIAAYEPIHEEGE
jgi:hypothetical protein